MMRTEAPLRDFYAFDREEVSTTGVPLAHKGILTPAIAAAPKADKGVVWREPVPRRP